MKFIFVTRLFSGLIESVETGQWNPFGVPAIYKLWERLHETDVSTDIIFLCKTRKESNNFKKITKVHFPGFHSNFYVIPFYGLGIKSSRISTLVNDILQLVYFLSRLLRTKYDLLYCDRANIKCALVGSLLGFKTIIRFLGIGNFNSVFNSLKRKFRSPFMYLSLKKRHDLIICSEDGSPARYLFKKHLNRKTPVTILLNGIEKRKIINRPTLSIRKHYNFEDDIPIFLFVGRVSEDKSTSELIQSLVQLKLQGKGFYAVLICGGSNFDYLKTIVEEHDLSENIIFEKYVYHKQIFDYYRQADVYISLNKYGNLSNTVLEAMNEGKCIIMLGKNDHDHTDESTEKFVPDDVVIRIDRKKIVDDLTDKLADLCENQEKIAMYSERMRKFALESLWSWDERIDHEIELLQKVARGERIFEAKTFNHNGLL